MIFYIDYFYSTLDFRGCLLTTLKTRLSLALGMLVDDDILNFLKHLLCFIFTTRHLLDLASTG